MKKLKLNNGTEVKNNRAFINLIRIVLSYSSICLDDRWILAVMWVIDELSEGLEELKLILNKILEDKLMKILRTVDLKKN